MYAPLYIAACAMKQNFLQTNTRIEIEEIKCNAQTIARPIDDNKWTFVPRDLLACRRHAISMSTPIRAVKVVYDRRAEKYRDADGMVFAQK